MTAKNSIESATVWSGADAVLRIVFGFGITVVLARLLQPAEFGVIAMLLVFTSIAGLFIDAGFSSALIQKQKTSQQQETSVFWFNVGVALVLGLGLGLAGKAIAAFFHQPVLQPLAWVMGSVLVVNSLQSVHTSLLTRALNFRLLALCSLAATLVSGTVAIVLALNSAGVWSLAGQQLSGALVMLFSLWLASRWRPMGRPSVAGLLPLFRFGGFMLVSGLVDRIYTQSTSVLIGRLYSAAELGFYNRAMGTRQVPVDLITGIIGRVAFPAFAAMQEDRERVRHALKRAVQAAMLPAVPVMLGISVAAEPLVLTLYGPKWQPAVPYLQVLALAGAIWPIHVINLSVLMAIGRSKEFLKLEILKKLIGLAVLVIAAFQGILWLVWAQVLLGLVGLIVNTHYSHKLFDYGLSAQLADLKGILISSLIMAGAVLFIGSTFSQSLSAPQLLLLLGLIGAAFFVLLAFAFRLPGLDAFLALFRNRASARAGRAGFDAGEAGVYQWTPPEEKPPGP